MSCGVGSVAGSPSAGLPTGKEEDPKAKKSGGDGSTPEALLQKLIAELSPEEQQKLSDALKSGDVI